MYDWLWCNVYVSNTVLLIYVMWFAMCAYKLLLVSPEIEEKQGRIQGWFWGAEAPPFWKNYHVL